MYGEQMDYKKATVSLDFTPHERIFILMILLLEPKQVSNISHSNFIVYRG